MKRLLVMVAAIALATTFASADDLPPVILAGLPAGFTQTLRFTYSQTCNWGYSIECDKGNGNVFLEYLTDGPEVVVDLFGNFVASSSDGIWIVSPDGTASKLADIAAPTCQMSGSMSAVQTRTDVYAIYWNSPIGALFVVTSNREITYAFSQPAPDWCKGGGATGNVTEVHRSTLAMIQVEYPTSVANAAINNLDTRERAGPPLSRVQRFPSRITRRQPGNAASDPYFFRSSRRPYAGAR